MYKITILLYIAIAISTTNQALAVTCKGPPPRQISGIVEQSWDWLILDSWWGLCYPGYNDCTPDAGKFTVMVNRADLHVPPHIMTWKVCYKIRTLWKPDCDFWVNIWDIYLKTMRNGHYCKAR